MKQVKQWKKLLSLMLVLTMVGSIALSYTTISTNAEEDAKPEKTKTFAFSSYDASNARSNLVSDGVTYATDGTIQRGTYRGHENILTTTEVNKIAILNFPQVVGTDTYHPIELSGTTSIFSANSSKGADTTFFTGYTDNDDGTKTYHGYYVTPSTEGTDSNRLPMLVQYPVIVTEGISGAFTVSVGTTMVKISYNDLFGGEQYKTVVDPDTKETPTWWTDELSADSLKTQLYSSASYAVGSHSQQENFVKYRYYKSGENYCLDLTYTFVNDNGSNPFEVTTSVTMGTSTAAVEEMGIGFGTSGSASGSGFSESKLLLGDLTATYDVSAYYAKQFLKEQAAEYNNVGTGNAIEILKFQQNYEAAKQVLATQGFADCEASNVIAAIEKAEEQEDSLVKTIAGDLALLVPVSNKTFSFSSLTNGTDGTLTTDVLKGIGVEGLTNVSFMRGTALEQSNVLTTTGSPSETTQMPYSILSFPQECSGTGVSYQPTAISGTTNLYSANSTYSSSTTFFTAKVTEGNSTTYYGVDVAQISENVNNDTSQRLPAIRMKQVSVTITDGAWATPVWSTETVTHNTTDYIALSVSPDNPENFQNQLLRATSYATVLADTWQQYRLYKENNQTYLTLSYDLPEYVNKVLTGKRVTFDYTIALDAEQHNDYMGIGCLDQKTNNKVSSATLCLSDISATYNASSVYAELYARDFLSEKTTAYDALGTDKTAIQILEFKKDYEAAKTALNEQAFIGCEAEDVLAIVADAEAQDGSLIKTVTNDLSQFVPTGEKTFEFSNYSTSDARSNLVSDGVTYATDGTIQRGTYRGHENILTTTEVNKIAILNFPQVVGTDTYHPIELSGTTSIFSANSSKGADTTFFTGYTDNDDGTKTYHGYYVTPSTEGTDSNRLPMLVQYPVTVTAGTSGAFTVSLGTTMVKISYNVLFGGEQYKTVVDPDTKETPTWWTEELSADSLKTQLYSSASYAVGSYSQQENFVKYRYYKSGENYCLDLTYTFVNDNGSNPFEVTTSVTLGTSTAAVEEMGIGFGTSGSVSGSGFSESKLLLGDLTATYDTAGACAQIYVDDFLTQFNTSAIENATDKDELLKLQADYQKKSTDFLNGSFEGCAAEDVTRVLAASEAEGDSFMSALKSALGPWMPDESKTFDFTTMNDLTTMEGVEFYTNDTLQIGSAQGQSNVLTTNKQENVKTVLSFPQTKQDGVYSLKSISGHTSIYSANSSKSSSTAFVTAKIQNSDGGYTLYGTIVALASERKASSDADYDDFGSLMLINAKPFSFEVDKDGQAVEFLMDASAEVKHTTTENIAPQVAETLDMTEDNFADSLRKTASETYSNTTDAWVAYKFYKEGGKSYVDLTFTVSKYTGKVASTTGEKVVFTYKMPLNSAKENDYLGIGCLDYDNSGKLCLGPVTAEYDTTTSYQTADFETGTDVEFYGRAYKNASGTMQASWAGDVATFAFEGTDAYIDVSAKNITINAANKCVSDTNNVPLSVYVDGTLHKEVTVEEGELESIHISMSESGTYQVRLFKHTSAIASSLSINEIRVGGEFAEYTERTKTIEIIGDSITEGYGLAAEGDIGYDTKNNCNTAVTAPAQVADLFGAKRSIVAVSGIGAYYSNNDDLQTLSEVYKYCDAYNDDDQTMYEPGEKAPDVIIVNVGTNDWQYGVYAGEITTEQHIEHMVVFLKMLHEKNPNAEIILFYGLMGDKTVTEGQKAYAANLMPAYQTMVEDMCKDGAAYLTYCQSEITDHNGQVSHPSLAANTMVVPQLARAVADVTDWETDFGSMLDAYPYFNDFLTEAQKNRVLTDNMVDAVIATDLVDLYDKYQKLDATEQEKVTAFQEAELTNMCQTYLAPTMEGATIVANMDMNEQLQRVQYNIHFDYAATDDKAQFGILYAPYSSIGTGDEKFALGDMTLENYEQEGFTKLYITKATGQVKGDAYGCTTGKIVKDSFTTRYVARAFVKYGDTVWYSDTTTSGASVPSQKGVSEGYCCRSVSKISQRIMTTIYEGKNDSTFEGTTFATEIENYITKTNGVYAWGKLAYDIDESGNKDYLPVLKFICGDYREKIVEFLGKNN